MLKKILLSLVILSLIVVLPQAFADNHNILQDCIGCLTNESRETRESNYISANTDKKSYSEGDIIIITGKVGYIVGDTLVSVVMIDPNGDLVSALQVTVGTNKKFSTKIPLGEDLMKLDGYYTVKVQYGTDHISDSKKFIFKSNTPILGSDLSQGCADCEIVIDTRAGSASTGCEKTADGCYYPSSVSVDAGDVIIFKNTDNSAHTFTSGTPQDGPNEYFDTGLLMPGNSLEYRADKITGEILYYCMVHPWMQGLIVVGSGDKEIVVMQSPIETLCDPEIVYDAKTNPCELIIGTNYPNTNQLKNEIINLKNEIIVIEDKNSDLQKNNTQLKVENKMLKNTNNIFKEKIEDLESIIMEQIKVIMDGIGQLKNRN